MTRLFSFAGAAVAVLPLLGGCGLISSDVTDFTLSLPEREVALDTADWGLSDDENLPAVDCSSDATVCDSAVEMLCGAEECGGVCSDEETCSVTVAVSLWHTLDLAAERPELQAIEGQPLVEVEVDRIFYSIDENTLNVESPLLTVYAAPAGVMSPSDPSAEAIGTIAPLAAMEVVDERDVELTADGQDILAARMKDYSTPFNLIIGAEVVVEAGDPLPVGHMVATVKATATASTGL